MPNRILKESICTSDSIDSLTWFEECLFYRMIVNCDDFGRFDGRIAVIKNRLFPLKENLTLKTVSDAINNLARAGLVMPYECDGKPFLYLPSWNEHQNVRAKRSKYPEPDNVNTYDCNCMHMNANVPDIQSNPNPIRNPNPIMNISCAPEPHDSNFDKEEQLKKDFEIIYGIYPKKKGKTVAFANYKQWISEKGKDVGGKRYRLTNRQIYLAVKKYIRQQEEAGQDDLQYWKNFDTLMGRQLLDYVEVEDGKNS